MKWLAALVLVLCMVTAAMADDPYIAIVGTDCVPLSTNTYGQLCNIGFISFADPFYFSEKQQSFMYMEHASPFFIPNTFGTFPPINQYTRAGGTGTEQFRSQTLNNVPEICDPTPLQHGLRNAVTAAGNSGFYEWFVRLPKKPSGVINLILQCGVLIPNALATYHNEAIVHCAAEAGERVGRGICARQEVTPNTNPLIVAALPKITAIAYPGPYNVAFAPFHLTAYRNPGTYAPFTAAGGQVLNGTANGTRIELKACMDTTIATKLPVTDTLNALGELETDLEKGDMIFVRMDVPRNNTVDVYCNAQSLRLMGIGESPE